MKTSLAALLFVASFLLPSSVKAEDARPEARASALVENWGSSNQSSCRTTSILGLCGTTQTLTSRPSSSKAWAAAGNGWHNLKSLKMNLTKMSAGKVSPNKFFQLVKLFIDDLQVAEVGNTRIKLSISIE